MARSPFVGSAGLLVGLVLALAGCASKSADAGGAGRRDAAAESRTLTLTLWPFYEIPESASGFGEPVSLGGVEVCVAKQRPYDGVWTDFETTHGPCATTEPDKNVVLEGAPASSELLVTAACLG